MMDRPSPAQAAPPSASKPIALSRRAAEPTVRALLIYAGVMAWFAVPVLTVRSLAPGSTLLPWIAGATASLSLVALLWTFRASVASRYTSLLKAISLIPERSWVAVCLTTGILIRLVWIAAFPGSPVSDGATYVGLARKLIAGEPYLAGGTLAYWPPGYPLFLVPWLVLIPLERVAIVTANLLLFVAGALGVRSLAQRVSDDGSMRVALALFVVWPNLAFQAGMPEKEQVLVALLPWIVSLAVLKNSDVLPFRKCLLGGLLLGMATLVQPALQLFPAVLLGYWLICSRSFTASLRMLVFTVLGMAIVIGPWTLRNYRIFDQFVLVSTNGGFGVYGANNPEATGGYLERWPEDLMRMPELEADREGKRRAAAWIVANPARFLNLAFEKNILFMGDDATGAYQTLKRGKGSHSEMTYAAAKAGSNLFWLAIWALLLWGLLANGAGRKRNDPAVLIVPLAFLYFLLLHSIVESSGKYHVLTIGVLSVLVPMVLTSRYRQINASS
jgi:hypothetical protein